MVLLSLELNWPLDAFCISINARERPDENGQRGQPRKSYRRFLNREGEAYLEEVLKRDYELYRFAQELHQAQLAWHNKARRDVGNILRQYSSAPFQAHCREITKSVSNINLSGYKRKMLAETNPKEQICHVPKNSLALWQSEESS